MEIEQRRNEAYLDKNGKYLNKNDVVWKDGDEYVVDDVYPPLMLAHVYDGEGKLHHFIPSELEKEEYVI